MTLPTAVRAFCRRSGLCLWLASGLPACSLSSWFEGAKTPETARGEAAPARRAAAKSPAVAPERESARRVGDVVVHRFSGAYRNAEVTLSERVIAREGPYWVVDLELDDGASQRRLRVRLDGEGRPLSAARMDGEREAPVPIDDYYALIEPTVFAAERNDGLVGAERGTCLVGPAELACETKKYEVWVAGQAGVLSVTTSSELPGRDVSGEITSADGRLLYRAELVELERGRPASSIAAR